MTSNRWRYYGLSLEQRILAQVTKTETCWLWTGLLDRHGYGRLHLPHGKASSPHKTLYELMRGPIPQGLQIDHLCRNSICVNPDHLEPVTNRENVLRGTSFAAQQARQTHCINGHQFTEDNTYHPPKHPVERECRTCRRDYAAAYYLTKTKPRREAY